MRPSQSKSFTLQRNPTLSEGRAKRPLRSKMTDRCGSNWVGQATAEQRDPRPGESPCRSRRSVERPHLPALRQVRRLPYKPRANLPASRQHDIQDAFRYVAQRAWMRCTIGER